MLILLLIEYLLTANGRVVDSLVFEIEHNFAMFTCLSLDLSNMFACLDVDLGDMVAFLLL